MVMHKFLRPLFQELRCDLFYVVSSRRYISAIFSNKFQTARSTYPANVLHFHHSTRKYGLEDFFDKPENFGKKKLKVGMAWSKDLLRRKGTEDLQKLWFILLKERNMLNTLEHYCSNHDEPMPVPERMEKVAESMSNLRDVIEEREVATNMLHHGTPDKTAGEWRKNVLGEVYFHKYEEHLLPKELQKDIKEDQPLDIAEFHPQLEEWHLRMEERGLKKRSGYHSLVARKYSHIRKSNPHLPKKMPQWFANKFKTQFRYGIHPTLPIFLKFEDKDPRIMTVPHKHN